MTGPARCESLRIGTEGDYPPFSFYNADGRLTGFEVDLGNRLCDIIDASCQWELMKFSDLIPALLEGRIDAIMGSVAITAERRKRLAFSTRYYSTPIRFIAERNRTLTINPARLAGLRIGAGNGHDPRRLYRPQPERRCRADALRRPERDAVGPDRRRAGPRPRRWPGRCGTSSIRRRAPLSPGSAIRSMRTKGSVWSCGRATMIC